MHGLVLGKFMPPHQGHLYLIDFARHYTEDLTVVVGSLASEPIAGQLRWRWMREIFPQLRVVHLTDENPQLPHEHPDFWNIWRRSLERVAERPVDLLFASEDYGSRLAEELGARFIPTNGARELLTAPASCFPSAERPCASAHGSTGGRCHAWCAPTSWDGSACSAPSRPASPPWLGG